MQHYKVPAHLWEGVKQLIQNTSCPMPISAVVAFWCEIDAVKLCDPAALEQLKAEEE
jgi:hypothetical protein